MQSLDGGYDSGIPTPLPISSTTLNRFTFLCLCFLIYKMGTQSLSVTFSCPAITLHKCSNTTLKFFFYTFFLWFIYGKFQHFSPKFEEIHAPMESAVRELYFLKKEKKIN